MENLKNNELEVQFENLQYMNSSTIPPIIELIKNLEQHRIKSIITYDKNSEWQAASFRALEVIAKSLEHITVIGR